MANDGNVMVVSGPPPTPAAALTVAPKPTTPTKFGENLLGRLGEALGDALKDISSLEVRTFTSSATDATLANAKEPLGQSMRLRAYSRIAMDGDTQVCVPVKSDGAPDEALWKIHNDVVTQARADRAAAIAMAIAAVQKLARAVR